MTFRTHILDEPELEFGNGGCHVDPRLGLTAHGPLQPMPGDRVTIGVIGTSETYDGFEAWMERLTSSIPGKSKKHPNLFPPFPGLGNQNPFQCRFEVSSSARRILPAKDIGDIVRIKKHAEAVPEAAELFFDQAQAMLEGSDRPDVIVAALPFDLILRVVNQTTPLVADDATLTTDDNHEHPLDFRDLFKAKTLNLACPTQLVWPTLWDDNARIPRKLKKTNRTVQDPRDTRLELAQRHVLQSRANTVATAQARRCPQHQLRRHRVLPRPRRTTTPYVDCANVRRTRQGTHPARRSRANR